MKWPSELGNRWSRQAGVAGFLHVAVYLTSQVLISGHERGARLTFKIAHEMRTSDTTACSYHGLHGHTHTIAFCSLWALQSFGPLPRWSLPCGHVAIWPCWPTLSRPGCNYNL